MPVFQRNSDVEVANGMRREVRLRLGTLFLAVSLGVVLSCCHARGDEPASAQESVGRTISSISRPDS